MEALIARYGLAAIFAGAGIEGEPFALAGGVLAERHLLAFWAALVASFAGSCLIDQGWFHLARHARGNRWVRSIARRPAFARSIALLERHPVGFVLLFRFAYGLRAVAPVAIGLSRIATRLFAPLNVAAAAAWSLLFTSLGYLAGPTVARLFDRFGTILGLGTVALSVAALALALRRGPRGKSPASRARPRRL